MFKLVPFDSQKDARTALDNGGRFYNLFTHQNDGEISLPELAKAAGVYANRQQMFLYLALALAELPEDQANEIYELLSPDLKKSRQAYTPIALRPSSAVGASALSHTAVVTGIPTYVQSRQEQNSLMVVPSFGVTVPIPLTTHYHYYEIRDDESSEQYMLAQASHAEKLEPRRTRFGGLIKSSASQNSNSSRAMLILEAMYYTPL